MRSSAGMGGANTNRRKSARLCAILTCAVLTCTALAIATGLLFTHSGAYTLSETSALAETPLSIKTGTPPETAEETEAITDVKHDITLTYARHYLITSLYIQPGCVESEEAFYEYGCPQTLLLQTAYGSFEVDIRELAYSYEAALEGITIELEEPLPSNGEIYIDILEERPGSAGSPVCIGTLDADGIYVVEDGLTGRTIYLDSSTFDALVAICQEAYDPDEVRFGQVSEIWAEDEVLGLSGVLEYFDAQTSAWTAGATWYAYFGIPAGTSDIGSFEDGIYHLDGFPFEPGDIIVLR